MHVYKFRILSEEQNDFVRDIEISSNQTFEDFHKILLQTSGLDGKELASFHITNGKWMKSKEITLIDMMQEEKDFQQEFEENEEEETFQKTFIMKDSRLKDFIDDPHQRMIYEYDFLKLKTFYIELIRIAQAKNNIDYPVCVRSKGELELKKTKPTPENGSANETAEGLNPEKFTLENIFDESESDEIQTNSNLELDDGFEEFKPY